MLKSGLGAAPDELIIGANDDKSKGYQLFKAMGFKDRGSSKYCFKHYDEESSLSSDDSDSNYMEFKLPKKRLPSKKASYYNGPIAFKDNFNGLGYEPTPNEV